LDEYDARAKATAEGDKITLAALPQPRNDFATWSVAQAKTTGPQHCNPRVIASRVLGLNAAAVHTSSFALTNAVFDIAASPPEVIAELRSEILAQLEAHGDEPRDRDGLKRWNKRALAKMEKLDSFLRESQRLNSLGALGLNRYVGNPQGITTPISNVHLAKNTHVVVSLYTSLRDEQVYGPNANEARPFRFSEQRQEIDEKAAAAAAASTDRTTDPKSAGNGNGNANGNGSGAFIERARKAFPTTSPEYLIFGHGKYACPGRFFASNEIKMMLAHAVVAYDFERMARPPNTWFNFNYLPPFKANVRVRRREKIA
jgi:cytochrome P450